MANLTDYVPDFKAYNDQPETYSITGTYPFLDNESYKSSFSGDSSGLTPLRNDPTKSAFLTQGIDYSQGAAPSSAEAGGGALAAVGAVAGKIPWLGALNLGVTAWSAWARYKAAREAAAMAERNYQENVRQFNESMGFQREQLAEKIRMYEQDRQDKLKQLWSAKLQYMMEKQPFLKQRIKTMNAARQNPRAARLLSLASA